MDIVMIIKETILRELIPAENMHLTDGKVIAEKSVFLGDGDSMDNWYEITKEEAERIKTDEILSFVS